MHNLTSKNNISHEKLKTGSTGLTFSALLKSTIEKEECSSRKVIDMYT